MLLKRPKIFNIDIRLCYNNTLEQSEKSVNSHPFIQSTINSYVELSSHLKENLISKTGGLVIVNRPYGLQKEAPKERKPWQKKIIIRTSPCTEPLSHLTFTGVIPYFRRDLGLPVILVKAPDRYMSGISILSSKERVTKLIHKAFLPACLPHCTYLLVCQGIPLKSNDCVRIGLTQKIDGQTKRPFFVEKHSKRSVRKELVAPLTFQHRVLSSNEELDVSLVEILNNRNKWHGIRAYCAQKLLAPVLGDQLFGSYVKVLNGVRLAVDVMSPAVSRPCTIPTKILQALQLTPRYKHYIPVHIHFAMLNFLKYRKNNGKVFIAKPPDYFLWTCERLRLEIPEYYSRNAVLNEIPGIENENISSSQNDNIQNNFVEDPHEIDGAPFENDEDLTEDDIFNDTSFNKTQF